jgi:hypothetical protein
MSPTKTKAPANGPAAPTAAPVSAAGAPTPALSPQRVISAPPVDGAGGPGGPALQPPGTEAAGLGGQAPAAGVTLTSATVGGLWTSNNTSNAWVYLNAVGWRRLSPANAGAHQAMLEIARLAKDGNITAQCEEDGSVIHVIYLW